MVMILDEIDGVIDKAGRVPLKYENDGTGNNDAEVSNILASLAMGRLNRGIHVTNEWAMFLVPAMYHDYDGGATLSGPVVLPPCVRGGQQCRPIRG